MKFIGGFIAGIVTTLLVLFLINSKSGSNDDTADVSNDIPGLTLLPEKGECITQKNLEIFQTLAPNKALARFIENSNLVIVLLTSYVDEYYYDNQVVPIPPNNCARRIGTYQYETSSGTFKTVPVVVIE